MAPKNQKFDGLLLYKTLNLMKTSSFIYFLYSPLTPIHLLECNDPILRGSHSLILLNMWFKSATAQYDYCKKKRYKKIDHRHPYTE